MKKKSKNYLDYIPKHNILFPYVKKENGRIEVRMKNRGLLKRVTQVALKKPKYTYIELDEFGSFVWEQIDGTASIYEIGQTVKARFGEKAEPLYERLSKFMQLLRRSEFIVFGC